jgi:hypothetical protein
MKVVALKNFLHVQSDGEGELKRDKLFQKGYFKGHSGVYDLSDKYAKLYIERGYVEAAKKADK